MSTHTSTQTIDTTPAHDCGLCDAPLKFAGVENGYRTWDCTACDWRHTSQDCCDTQPRMTLAELERRGRAGSMDDVFPPTPAEIAARNAAWPNGEQA